MSTDSTNVKTKDSILKEYAVNDTLIPIQSVDSSMLIDSVYNDSLQFTAEVRQEKIFFEGKPIHSNQEHWISGLILFCFVLLAYINFNYRRRLSQMIKAVFAKNYMNQLIREGNFFKERVSLLLLINYALIIPLFIYFSFELLFPFKGISKNIQIYSCILLISFSIWIFKILVVKLNSIIFKTPKPAYEILLYIFINNLILSLIILPLISIYYFTQIELFLFFGLGISLSIYIIRIIREFMIGLSYSIFSVLHLFLYLCCLEIIPVVILIKIISDYYLL